MLLKSGLMETAPEIGIGHFEALFAYWEHLRDAVGGVPARLSLDPVGIRELLPFIFLVERRSHTDLYVRLSGTAIDSLSPVPMTGANYLDLCPAENRAFVADSAKAVCTHPCGHKLKRVVTFEDGTSHEVTTAALPMTDRDGNCSYLLGVMVSRTDHLSALSKIAGNLDVKLMESEFFDIGFGVPQSAPAFQAPVFQAL